MIAGAFQIDFMHMRDLQKRGTHGGFDLARLSIALDENHFRHYLSCCKESDGARCANNPSGRQIMISTMPAPNATIPKSSTSRKTSGKPTKKAAPNIIPSG